MKYFVDLGCYVGKMLDRALVLYPDCDRYIGFEPVPKLARKLVQKYKANPKVQINPWAADNVSGSARLFLSRPSPSKGPPKPRKKMSGKGFGFSQGSTLFGDKTSGRIRKDDYVKVVTVDTAEYLHSLCQGGGRVILKVDIEGKEYDVLEHLIDTGAIKLIDAMFVEWHYDRIPGIAKSRHDALVAKLRELGFANTVAFDRAGV